MFCPKCGTQNKDGANFCESCGANLPQQPSQQAATQPTQAPQNQVAYAQQAQAAHPKKRGLSTGAIVGIVCGVVAVIAAIVVAIVLFTTSRPAPEPEKNEEFAALLESSIESIHFPTKEEQLAEKIVGYWEGYDIGGNGYVTTEEFKDGICTVTYYGNQVRSDSGPYWFEGDTLYVQGQILTEPYDYQITFIDDNTMLQISGDSKITLNRKEKPAEPPAPTPAPAPEPTPAPAPAPSPYELIAGTWYGTLQDGFPVTFTFGTDQHFWLSEDGVGIDDGPYTISGSTITLNGMNGTDTYEYSLNGDSLTLEIPGAGAYFYFTR